LLSLFGNGLWFLSPAVPGFVHAILTAVGWLLLAGSILRSVTRKMVPSGRAAIRARNIGDAPRKATTVGAPTGIGPALKRGADHRLWWFAALVEFRQTT